MQLGLGLFLGTRVTGSPGASLSVALEGDGTVSITASGGDTLSITISGGTLYDGTYSVTLADLATGPVKLVDPVIAGTASVGQTLTSTPGLWIYTGTAPTITYQWRRGSSDISAATSSSYTVVSADQGYNVTLRETATQTAGARSADSNAKAIPAAPSLDIARIGSNYFGSTDGVSNPSFLVDLSGLSVGDEIVAVVVDSRYASALSLTTGGGALTKRSTDTTINGYGCVSIFSRAVVSSDIGASEIFVATLDQSTSHHALVLYRVQGGTVSTVAIQTRGGVSTTLTATPSGATAAALIAVAAGITTDTAEPTFGGATKVETEIVTGTNRLVSSATNTSPSSNTVTAATATAFVAGLAVIAVSAT